MVGSSAGGDAPGGGIFRDSDVPITVSVAGTGWTRTHTKIAHNLAATSGDNVSGSLPEAP